MKCQKKEDSIVADPTLEAQAHALVDAPQTALVPKEDVRVEAIKKSNGEGTRLAARARTGKFMSRTEASAMVAAKDTQTFLSEVDAETGVSRHKSLLNKLYEGAKKAADEPRALGNSVKAVELLDEISGHRAIREEALSNKDHIQDKVRIVVIAPVTLMHPEIVDFDKKKPEAKAPSFAAAEVVYTNPQEPR
jgi:hypothetical protein